MCEDATFVVNEGWSIEQGQNIVCFYPLFSSIKPHPYGSVRPFSSPSRRTKVSRLSPTLDQLVISMWQNGTTDGTLFHQPGRRIKPPWNTVSVPLRSILVQPGRYGASWVDEPGQSSTTIASLHTHRHHGGPGVLIICSLSGGVCIHSGCDIIGMSVPARLEMF